jgi:CheY-like chemotaxis protein
MFAYQAKEKKLLLEYQIDESLNLILLGDPVRLNQILINLISNAVKFTHRGNIHVSCRTEAMKKRSCIVNIQVHDTGVGVPADKLDKIFESFSQADASVTRNYGGSGLGLTIVKQLVELQRGSIKVKSEEHHGSDFIVRIPYTLAKSDQLKKMSIPKSFDAVTGKKLQDTKILLVEDNDINRLYAKSILRKWNCSVDIAENGLVAIEKVKNNIYDVVLMDVQMPVMDGYEATRAIRLMDSHMRHAPIVALTANATKTDIEKCLSSGMNDYLPKPFTPDDLYRKIFRDLKISKKKNGTAKKNSAGKKGGFDLTYLRSVSENNEEFIQEMIRTFVQTIPSILHEMEISLSVKNWGKISRLAHQLKPSFAMMEMEDLRRTALHIEKNSEDESNPDELARLTWKFIHDCQILIDDLKKEITPA